MQQSEAKRMLVQSGLRCTRQRLSVYSALMQSREHPTADQIHKMVCDGEDDISLATVYNTLDVLTRAGLVQKLAGSSGVAGGPTRFDAATDNHLHLRCARTGDVGDVPDHVGRKLLDCISPELIDDLQQQLGFKIDQVKIELVGQYEAAPSPIIGG